jgi:transcription initiation factor TFIIIB Brf1 subunit/transcription initiation factor TFIIB
MDNPNSRCKKCNSTQVYFRKKDQKIVCKKCGKVQEYEDEDMEVVVI